MDWCGRQGGMEGGKKGLAGRRRPAQWRCKYPRVQDDMLLTCDCQRPDVGNEGKCSSGESRMPINPAGPGP